jgi:hypothetical protein
MHLLSATGALRISVFALLTAAICQGAELKGETLHAWADYTAQVDQQTEQSGKDRKCFLRIDEDKNRFGQLLAGAIIVEPVGEHVPIHVPSGLIHHWMGAVFVPNATIADLLAVTRDYAHYRDYYKPGVANGEVISRSESKDDFTIRIVNNSLLSSTSLLGTYTTTFVPQSEKRWYSISATSQMREIKSYGSPDEEELEPGHGSGYIWRLHTVARMEERDGGVVLELEALALSRDIPAALRCFVDPIVRRISRDSLEKSLNETAQAVRGHLDQCAREAHQSGGVNRIMVSRFCSQHADYSGLWDQKLARNASR